MLIADFLQLRHIFLPPKATRTGDIAQEDGEIDVKEERTQQNDDGVGKQ